MEIVEKLPSGISTRWFGDLKNTHCVPLYYAHYMPRLIQITSPTPSIFCGILYTQVHIITTSSTNCNIWAFDLLLC